MIKLLTDLWRECTICAVFFSMSLMVSIMYLLRSIIHLASVIARKVELKAMAPTHCSFSVSGNSLENLIGISPEIMAYGYHRGINECYAGTSSESSQIKKEHELEEHAAFQLHKAVVRHSFRKIRLHRTLNEEQVVVLEIAERTEMEIQQNRHYFTI